MIRHFLVSLLLYIAIIGTSLVILGIAKTHEEGGVVSAGLTTQTQESELGSATLTKDQKRRQEAMKKTVATTTPVTVNISACEQFKFANC